MGDHQLSLGFPVMKIFIAIRVPHVDPTAETLVSMLEQVLSTNGHIPFVAYREIKIRELTPAQFMPYVREEISTSNIVLVVYSPDLRGGLIEMGIAYALGVPVWLAVRKGERVSTSARACARRIFEYEDRGELADKLRIATIKELDNGTPLYQSPLS